jgi:ribosome recycling factor
LDEALDVLLVRGKQYSSILTSSMWMFHVLTGLCNNSTTVLERPSKPNALKRIPQPLSTYNHRFFTATHYRAKHGKRAGKYNTAHAKTDESPTSEAAVSTATDEAYDLSSLEANILRAIERLSHDLSLLRAGGRFNTDLLEGIKVTLKKGPGKGLEKEKETALLRDIAQVISRGRLVSVVAFDEEVSFLSTKISCSVKRDSND